MIPQEESHMTLMYRTCRSLSLAVGLFALAACAKSTTSSMAPAPSS